MHSNKAPDMLAPIEPQLTAKPSGDTATTTPGAAAAAGPETARARWTFKRLPARLV